MTDTRSPLDAALDLVVFAPVGLALTIGEELPKLAAKGRSTMTARVTTARIVGQFAVTQGRREVERRLRTQAPPAPNPAAAPAAPAAGPSPAATSGGPAAAPQTLVGGAAQSATATNGAAPAPAAPVTPVPARAQPPAPTPAPPATGAAPPTPPKAAAPSAVPRTSVRPSPVRADALAIPSYDSLSASQVVQRLAGLSHDELEAVKHYEAATRGRRTILARISQLQS